MVVSLVASVDTQYPNRCCYYDFVDSETWPSCHVGALAALLTIHFRLVDCCCHCYCCCAPSFDRRYLLSLAHRFRRPNRCCDAILFDYIEHFDILALLRAPNNLVFHPYNLVMAEWPVDDDDDVADVEVGLGAAVAAVAAAHAPAVAAVGDGYD